MSEALPCCTAQQVRDIEAHAIAAGIPGFELMQRAAAAAFAALRAQWPQLRHCIVCCGGGNNGGDGFVIAALAQQAGLDTRIVLAAAAADLKGDARLAYELALARNVPVLDAAQCEGFAAWSRRDAVIVDALLGTGLRGPARAAQARLIALINASGLPVLAVDLPSGLDSDSGAAPGPAVRADLTVTFIACKPGLLRGRGPQLCGRIVGDSLALPAALYAQVGPAAGV